MEARPISFEIKVGIFVCLGLLIMFFIVFTIGEFYMFKPVTRLKVLFNFANGIAMGSPVRLAGIDVGEIEGIKIYYDETMQRTRVMLIARVQADTRIENDAVCRINTLGLLGEKYLEITPGTAEAGFAKDQDVVVGYDPIPMEEITKTMKELADSAKQITDSARVVMKRLENGEGTVGKLLVEEKIYNDLEDFVADIKSHPWKLLVKGRDRSEPRQRDMDTGDVNNKGMLR